MGIVWLALASAWAGWVEVETEHFVVYGDGPTAAKTAAQRMEDFHGVLSQVYVSPLPVRPAARVPVLAFSDGPSFKPYVPLGANGKPDPNIGGLHLKQPGSTLIALSISSGGHRVVQHEYVHHAMNSPRSPLPTWLNEGLAEYYSTAESTPKSVLLGIPPYGAVPMLQQRKWIPLDRLFAVTTRSTEYSDRDWKSLFYAQSWLLVHWCLAGGDGDRRARLADLASRLDAGTPPAEAIQAAFGTSEAGLTEALQSYVAGLNLPTLTIQLPKPLPRVKTPAVEVSDAERDARLGLLLTWVGRAEEAQPLLVSAAAHAPFSPLGHEGLGWAALFRDDPAAAHASFATAVERGSTNPGTLLAYAATGFGEDGLRDPAEGAALQSALERAVGLDPDLTAAYVLLVGLALAREDAEAANAWLQKGLAIDPHHGELRFQLALSHLRNNRPDFARTTLQRVLEVGDPELQARANELLGQLPP